MALETFEPMANICDLIDYWGRTQPEAEALVIEDERESWGAFREQVNRIANALIGLGVDKGDKVAILARTSPEYFNSFFGILQAGACAVPLSGMATTETIALMIDDSDARVLMISRDMKGLIDPVDGELGKIIDGGRIGFDFSDDTWRSFDEFVSGASAERP
ncbi:MAG: AMP-binding protein, partial [Alphaproteobacteria bacterium]|nr:AMP-binding protein [Alphaproteobacteria bacterium]